MASRPRVATAGFVFHVTNRGVRRSRLFHQAGDYRDCLRLLAEAQRRVPLRLLAYCLMPNHFHLVVWPSEDQQLSSFMRWFTATHSKRWHAWRGTTGTGSVYQGRFKAQPVQTDGHFFNVCRYVEANALRAGLVTRAEHWPWSSLAQRCRERNTVLLSPWPIPAPDGWLGLVNTTVPKGDLERLRRAVRRGAPYGSREWTERTARELRLTPNVQRIGRPRKTTSGVVLRKT